MSSIMTSIRLTTLMSALSGSCPARERRLI
jgi:hypothetical protein